MIRVDQTTFGKPAGNCFAACVASLLELRLEDVPFFMDAGPGGEWFDAFNAWLKTRGLYSLQFLVSNPNTPGQEWFPAGLHLMGGASPRHPVDSGILHCVVADNGEIIHDPNPARTGLLTKLDVQIVIPIDPSAWIRRP
jgi:hypothetical protein